MHGTIREIVWHGTGRELKEASDPNRLYITMRFVTRLYTVIISDTAKKIIKLCGHCDVDVYAHNIVLFRHWTVTAYDGKRRESDI